MRRYLHPLVKPTLSLLVFSVALTGCQSAQVWHTTHLQTGNPAYNSARLSYPVRDMVNGIAVEMIYSQGHARTYLAVHAQTIPPYKGNPKEALVVMKIDGKTFTGIAHRHEGGQRVSLPQQLHATLIQNLQQHHPITLVLEGYSTILEPANFSEGFEALRSAPFTNPFQLPFKL